VKYASLILPAPGGPVLEDLEVFKNGLACQQCEYVCISEDAMEPEPEPEAGRNGTAVAKDLVSEVFPESG